MSLATADAVVERLRAAVESTGAANFGAFAALHPLGDGRFLAASTDSIGTKPMVARPRGLLRNCGADMAAHCINDVITCGAEPLILLDYVAAANIELERVAELVEGAAGVCREAGVALVGGETAEMPDVYRTDELDFAATCVGVVEEPLDGSAIEAGDAVLGFPSAGVHSTSTSSAGCAVAPAASHTSREVASQAISSASSPPAEARRSTGTHGSARPSSRGSHATSARRNCAASSTSASAFARSWRNQNRKSS